MSDPRTYYDRATSWALDDQAKANAALRQARIFSGLAILIAVLEAFALFLLLPLKSVQVAPILVDRQTGFVEVLNPDGRLDIKANAALVQSLLAQYVVARESFDITQLAHDYRNVSLWSAGPARQDYLASTALSNPTSPLRTLPRSAIIEVQIKSISPLTPKVALVRFRTTRRDQAGSTPIEQDWAAVITYRLSDASMTFQDRLNNPLGFQVLRYHKDPETLSPPDALPPAAAAPVVVQSAAPISSVVPVVSAEPGTVPTVNAPAYPPTVPPGSLAPPVGAVSMPPRRFR